MPSRKGQGIHRVFFSCDLSCGHTVSYSIRPSVDDYVTCWQHDRPAKILKVTRQEVLLETA